MFPYYYHLANCSGRLGGRVIAVVKQTTPDDCGRGKPPYPTAVPRERFVQSVMKRRPIQRWFEMERVSSVTGRYVGVALMVADSATARAEFDYAGSVRKRLTGTSVTSS